MRIDGGELRVGEASCKVERDQKEVYGVGLKVMKWMNSKCN